MGIGATKLFVLLDVSRFASLFKNIGNSKNFDTFF
jgi:hypothetical protein